METFLFFDAYLFLETNVVLFSFSDLELAFLLLEHATSDKAVAINKVEVIIFFILFPPKYTGIFYNPFQYNKRRIYLIIKKII